VDRVLASDAGRSFVVPENSHPGLLKTALRAADLMMFRIRRMELAKAHARTNDKYIVLSISEEVEPSDNPRANSVAVQSILERLRTDLDVFNKTERDALIRHGYCVAQARMSALGGGVDEASQALQPERVALTEEQQIPIARRLQRGELRRWRLFSFGDPVAWMNAVLSLGLLLAGAFLIMSAKEPAQRAYHFFLAYKLTRGIPQWEQHDVRHSRRSQNI
jgi:hypothetical protein